jgi:hypothetical protein
MALKYKALEILNTFSENELKKFDLFMENCGHFKINETFIIADKNGHGKKLLEFYKALREIYPQFLDRLTNSYLKKRLEIRSDSNIKKYFTQLGILCDHFIVLREIETDKYYYDEALLYQYQTRNLKKYFVKKFKATDRKLNDSQLYNIKDYLMKFTTGLINYMISSQDIKMKKNSELDKIIKLQTTPSYNLLFYFVFDSMKVIIGLISHSNSYNVELEKIPFYKLFRESFPDKRLSSIIKVAMSRAKRPLHRKIIKLYWLNYLFRTHQNRKSGEYFKTYSDLLNNVSNKLSLSEKFDFYFEKMSGFWLALNFPEFEDIEFEFYDRYLANEGYKAPGKDKMTFIEFRNLLIRGDSTFRFEWTSSIIKKYLDAVPEQYHETLLTLRNANLYFTRDKEYDKTLAELSKLKNRMHYTVTQDILVLHIKIFYEQEHYDLCLHKLDSLNKYVSNQRLGSATARPYKKFISCTKKIIRLKLNEKTDIDKLKDTINKDNLIVSRKWLIEKISSIEQS